MADPRRSHTGARPKGSNRRNTTGARDQDTSRRAPPLAGHHAEQASTPAQVPPFHQYQQGYFPQAVDATPTRSAGVQDSNYHDSSLAGQISYQGQPLSSNQHLTSYRPFDLAAFRPALPDVRPHYGGHVVPGAQYYVPQPLLPTQTPGPVPVNTGMDMGIRPDRLLDQTRMDGGQRLVEGQHWPHQMRPLQQMGTAEYPDQQMMFTRPPSRPRPGEQRGGDAYGGQQQRTPAMQHRSQGRSLRGQSHVASSSRPVLSSRLNPQAQPFSPRSLSSASSSTDSSRQGSSSPATSRKSAQTAKTTSSADDAHGSRITGAPDVTAGFPRRPEHGRAGTAVDIRANFFPVELHENLIVHHYDVEIKKVCPPKSVVREGADGGAGPSGNNKPPPPPRVSKGCKYKIFREFCKEYGDIIAVFDGEKNMYTTTALPIPDEVFRDIFLERTYGQGGSDKFSFFARKVAELSRINEKAMVQVIDTALRQACSENRKAVGRLLFNYAKDDLPQLPGGIVVGEGLFTSLRIAESGVFINVDVVRAAFFDEAIDLASMAVCLLRAKGYPTPFSPRYRDRQIEMISGLFSRMSICFKHSKRPPKSLVQHVTKETAREIEFQHNGRSFSVASYFASRYPHPPICNPDFPCICVGDERYYPMEKCLSTKFGKSVDILKEFSLKERAKLYMRMTPKDKFARAKAAANEVASKSLLKSFFKDVSVSPVQISARKLELFQSEAGSQVPLTVDYWSIANACTYHDLEDCSNAKFATTLIAQGKALNVYLGEWYFHDCRSVGPFAMLQMIKSNFPGVQLVFVVLEKNSPRYSDIKYYAETEFGLITQCIAKATFDKPLGSVLSNVMRKVKAKLGRSERVMPAFVGAFKLADAMIIGADVSHHGPQENGKPSVAAIVGSIDAGASRYVATFRVQAPQDLATKKRIEIIEDMENAVKDLLRAYRKENSGAEPRKIVFYRDGVSEGQFSQVLESELRALRAACQELQLKPDITLLTVQKRHRTRFLSDKQHNVGGGTVVDTVITHPRDFDFYLCSHDSRLGTARPAHYYVLCDENGFTSDTLQKLTYGLCHVYARCKSPVSIPAPVYYAHHAAARASCYLAARGKDLRHRSQVCENTFTVSEQIKDKMFFI